MDLLNKDFYNTSVTLRITALWAFSEAFMGGILHGLQMPFAGLVLSLVASVCITLIALGNSKKGEILKATLLVIAVKFILSPHTPPMAYVAVLLQGSLGELLFINKRLLKPAAFILTVLSLLYSAFQQLLILTIVFGKGFWQAVDIFLNRVTQSFIHNAVDYSFYIIVLYVGCHILVGIAGGWLNIKIIRNVQSGNRTSLLLQQLNNLPAHNTEVFTGPKPAHRKQLFTLVFGGLVLLLLAFSYLPFFSHTFSQSKIAELIVRAVMIILVWNYFITPLLRLQIQKWVARYKQNNGNTLQQVITLLPGVKMILQQSWQLSQQPSKWLHFKSFINNTALLIVHHEQ